MHLYGDMWLVDIFIVSNHVALVWLRTNAPQSLPLFLRD